MALTAAQIEAKIETLQGGLALVESGVSFSDRNVTYRTVEELERAISYWERQLAALDGTRRRQTLVYASKGF